MGSGADQPLPLGAWTFPQCRWSLTTTPPGSRRSTSTESAGQPVQVSRQWGGLWGPIPPTCVHHEEPESCTGGSWRGYSPQQVRDVRGGVCKLGNCPLKSKGGGYFGSPCDRMLSPGDMAHCPSAHCSPLLTPVLFTCQNCRSGPCSEWVWPVRLGVCGVALWDLVSQV